MYFQQGNDQQPDTDDQHPGNQYFAANQPIKSDQPPKDDGYFAQDYEQHDQEFPLDDTFHVNAFNNTDYSAYTANN